MSKDHRNGMVQLSASLHCTPPLQQQPNKHTRVTPPSINYLMLKGKNILPCPVRVINFSANSLRQNCPLCGRKPSCIFYPSDSSLHSDHCFLFLAFSAVPSNMAKSGLALGLFQAACFRHTDVYLAFPTWPPPCLCGAFLLISHRLW